MNSKSKLLAPELVNAERPVWAFSKKIFCEGMRDGVPIALGYFAVSFSLGIAARNAGLTPIQGFFASLFNNASAGEYAAFSLIAAGATYLEVAIITLIANARYLLMSCALAQKFAPGTPFFHRLIIGYDVTDELFGITIARPGYLNPFYTYGAIALAAPPPAALSCLRGMSFRRPCRAEMCPCSGRFPICALLHSERAPFTRQKAVFCRLKHGLLQRIEHQGVTQGHTDASPPSHIQRPRRHPHTTPCAMP